MTTQSKPIKNAFWPCLAIIAFYANISSSFASHFFLHRAPSLIAREVVKEVTAVESLLNDLKSDEIEKTTAKSRYYFHRFKFRFEPRLHFGLSDIAELELYPIVEIEIIRDPPKGWKNFRPVPRIITRSLATPPSAVR
jgi:hypothetical protein